MYTHIRSQASDWNCCVKRLFVCTTVHIPISTYHVKREREIEAQTGVVIERERLGEREKEREISRKQIIGINIL